MSELKPCAFGPENTAVNHFIPVENFTLTLETFDDAVHLVLRTGRKCLISKGDVEDAYTNILISQLDYQKLGFTLL